MISNEYSSIKDVYNYTSNEFGNLSVSISNPLICMFQLSLSLATMQCFPKIEELKKYAIEKGYHITVKGDKSLNIYGFKNSIIDILNWIKYNFINENITVPNLDIPHQDEFTGKCVNPFEKYTQEEYIAKYINIDLLINTSNVE